MGTILYMRKYRLNFRIGIGTSQKFLKKLYLKFSILCGFFIPKKILITFFFVIETRDVWKNPAFGDKFVKSQSEVRLPGKSREFRRASKSKVVSTVAKFFLLMA